MTRFLTRLSTVFVFTLAPTLFGCGSNGQSNNPVPTAAVDRSGTADIGDIALLESEADRDAAIRQSICPVSGKPLGSMGKPIKINVQGRDVFLCCSGCEDSLREEPQKYFDILDSAPPTDE
jgi:hypothetical protein